MLGIEGMEAESVAVACLILRDMADCSERFGRNCERLEELLRTVGSSDDATKRGSDVSLIHPNLSQARRRN